MATIVRLKRPWRRLAGAMRRMRALGFPDHAIRHALGVSARRMAMCLNGTTVFNGGELELIRKEMART